MGLVHSETKSFQLYNPDGLVSQHNGNKRNLRSYWVVPV